MISPLCRRMVEYIFTSCHNSHLVIMFARRCLNARFQPNCSISVYRIEITAICRNVNSMQQSSLQRKWFLLSVYFSHITQGHNNKYTHVYATHDDNYSLKIYTMNSPRASDVGDATKHCLMQWIVSWKHRAITSVDFDLISTGLPGTFYSHVLFRINNWSLR